MKTGRIKSVTILSLQVIHFGVLIFTFICIIHIYICHKFWGWTPRLIYTPMRKLFIYNLSNDWVLHRMLRQAEEADDQWHCYQKTQSKRAYIAGNWNHTRFLKFTPIKEFIILHINNMRLWKDKPKVLFLVFSFLDFLALLDVMHCPAFLSPRNIALLTFPCLQHP